MDAAVTSRAAARPAISSRTIVSEGPRRSLESQDAGCLWKACSTRPAYDILWLVPYTDFLLLAKRSSHMPVHPMATRVDTLYKT